ncbi:MAG: glycosyltransferase [Caulobacter sp.]|nr:glycosyltransferase [Caulobacter sp.]
MARPTLIIFARAPAIGVGKTRLARDVGAVEAWRLYRQMSGRLIRTLADHRWRCVIRLAGAPGDPAWRSATIEDQGRGDLGQRLERALRAHSAGPVAVIGTDAPDVSPARIARAFAGTRGGQAVLGPAEDGGFWLLALPARRARAVSLAGVRWSGPDTLTDTEAALGGRVQRLETLADIDTGEDLARLRAAQLSARMSISRS